MKAKEKNKLTLFAYSTNKKQSLLDLQKKFKFIDESYNLYKKVFNETWDSDEIRPEWDIKRRILQCKFNAANKVRSLWLNNYQGVVMESNMERLLDTYYKYCIL